MSSAAELEDVLTLALEQAAEAAAEGDDARSVHLIETAGHALAAVYVNAPMWCPALVAELGDRSPRVRPGDLRAACAVAADDIDERTGDRPVLLHPDVITWVVAAVKLHRADVDGLLAACCVIIEVLAGSPTVVRPGGLPVSDELRELALGCRLEELQARIRVSELHLDAMRTDANAMRELAAMLRPSMTDGQTVEEALDNLHGSARTRAEELYASLPSVVTIGGGQC